MTISIHSMCNLVSIISITVRLSNMVLKLGLVGNNACMWTLNHRCIGCVILYHQYGPLCSIHAVYANANVQYCCQVSKSTQSNSSSHKKRWHNQVSTHWTMNKSVWEVKGCQCFWLEEIRFILKVKQKLCLLRTMIYIENVTDYHSCTFSLTCVTINCCIFYYIFN